MRSFEIRVVCDRLKLGWLCAIAVWGCGVRSLKIRGLCAIAVWGCWDAIAKRSVGIV
jgi:hypothetical protein